MSARPQTDSFLANRLAKLDAFRHAVAADETFTARAVPYVKVFDRSWYDQAACRDTDPNVFFPTRDESHDCHDVYAEARQLCAVCPVSSECLAAALERHEQHGYWNSTPRERRSLQRNRQGAA